MGIALSLLGVAPSGSFAYTYGDGSSVHVTLVAEGRLGVELCEGGVVMRGGSGLADAGAPPPTLTSLALLLLAGAWHG